MDKKRHIRRIKKVFGNALLQCILAAWGWTGITYAAQAQAGIAAKALAKKAAAGTAPEKPVESQSTSKARPVESGLRDPFKTPVLKPPEPPSLLTPGEEMLIPANLPPGSRGLVISQLKLEGIVRLGKNNPKMIAVLANPANRAFFLPENDPLFNGVITKITADSVYFSENVRNTTGTTSTREVVKRLAPAPGEKK